MGVNGNNHLIDNLCGVCLYKVQGNIMVNACKNGYENIINLLKSRYRPLKYMEVQCGTIKINVFQFLWCDSLGSFCVSKQQCKKFFD